MAGNLTIRQARLVLPERVVVGDLLVEDGVIADIGPHILRTAGEEIDGTGLTVLPGVIDPQVHFREPNADNLCETLASGSRAAAAGGVTAFLDMPNNNPACTTVEQLNQKLASAAENSVIHYGFFIGATADNAEELAKADAACGVSVSMSGGTRDLRISEREHLEEIIANANKVVAVHAEDEARLNERKQQYDGTTDVRDHPRIRDAECALRATKLAVELAIKHGRRLHILNLTSAEEVDFLGQIARDNITTEVCPQHLFMDADTHYTSIGTLAQCDPPVRTKRHADALWRGLVDGTINCIATDHEPHPLAEKQQAYPDSPSGMPNVEWSLPLLLNQHNLGRCTLQQIATWTSASPAETYGIPRKGRLEVGFDADLVLCDLQQQRTITHASTRSGCHWSPWDGVALQGWPVMTVVMGTPVYRDGHIIEGVRGRPLTFRRN